MVPLDEGVLSEVDDVVCGLGPSVNKTLVTGVCPGAYMTGDMLGSFDGN